jgi:hypothetical protein
MSLSSILHGGGRRRRTVEHPLELERLNRDLRNEAARLDPVECRTPDRHVEFLVRRPAGAPAPVLPLRCPACEIERREAQYRAQLSVLTAPQIPPGHVLVAAPADLPGSAFGEPEAQSEPVTEELRIVADTPTAPAECEAADVNAQTQATDVTALRAAVGLSDTAVLPVVAMPPEQPREPVDTSAVRLEAARMVPQLADPDRLVGFATSDLKDAVTVASLPGRSIAVRLTQTT